jgi:hypothetical protein
MFVRAGEMVSRQCLEAKAYPRRYVEPLSDERTKREAFFNILHEVTHGEARRDAVSDSRIAPTAMEPEGFL